MGCCGGEESNHVGVEDAPHAGKFGTARKFEPNFKGPIAKRSCTDVLCCLLFTIFLAGQGVVSYFAYSRGNPAMLIMPTDSRGNICGTGSKMSEPKLFYFDLVQCAKLGPQLLLNTACPTPSICVANCPTYNWVAATVIATELATSAKDIPGRAQMICQYGVNATTSPYLEKTVDQLVTENLCAPYILESESLAERCVPKVIFQVANLTQTVVISGINLVDSSNNSITGELLKEGSFVFQVASTAQAMFNDVVQSWWLIVIGFFISMITSFIWIVLLRLLAGCMVWFTLIFFVIVFLGSAGYCFYQYYYVATSSLQDGSFQFQLSAVGFQNFLNTKEIWLAFAIIAGVLGLVILLIMLCLRKRLQLAIGLIGQASKAVGSISSTLIYPLFPFIFQLGILAYWGATTVYLVSVSEPSYTSSNSTNVSFVCDDDYLNYHTLECNFFKYTGEAWSIILILITLFNSLWILNFIIAMGEMVLAGAFASWYWAWEKPKDVPIFPIFSSLKRTVCYHLGTLAFGSLIIAIIQFFRVILEYIDRKLSVAQNPVAKFILCCFKCCLWCLEKFMKFINKNAYIITAIYGTNFCSSAKDAFFLLMRNIVRVVVVDRVTAFVLLVGQLVIVGAVTTLAFFFFSGQIPTLNTFTPSLSYFYVPVIIIGIGTFLIARLFLSVFDFAVETLFLCVMEDLERNDGSPEKPYFMSSELMRILDKKNKFNDKSKKEGCGICCC